MILFSKTLFFQALFFRRCFSDFVFSDFVFSDERKFLIMTPILFQTSMAFLGCFALAIVFDAPRRELFFCGLSGALGWFVYASIVTNQGGVVLATVFSAMTVTFFAKYLSYQRYTPSTLYHICGILPLVPGTGVYNTMVLALQGDILQTYSSILSVLKVAGAIGGGSIIILALPQGIFQRLAYHKKDKFKK